MAFRGFFGGEGQRGTLPYFIGFAVLAELPLPSERKFFIGFLGWLVEVRNCFVKMHNAEMVFVDMRGEKW